MIKIAMTLSFPIAILLLGHSLAIQADQGLCPINEEIGDYIISFDFPYNDSCDKIEKKPTERFGANGERIFDFSITTERRIIQIHGEEVAPDMDINQSIGEKIRDLLISKYDCSRNIATDYELPQDAIKGIRFMGSKQGSKDAVKEKIWYILYWKDPKLNISKKLQISIIIEHVGTELIASNNAAQLYKNINVTLL